MRVDLAGANGAGRREWLWIALIFAAALPTALRADSWPAPVVREVFSPSRDVFVRVTPGTSRGDTVGFAGASKGSYAQAEFYRRREDRAYAPVTSATLVNPVAPIEFFVADDGTLVTLDNWHNRGHGQVIAVYAPDGKLRRSYALSDLFSGDEIGAFTHSVSSIAWHTGPAYLRADQKALYIGVRSGSDLIVDLATGSFSLCETRQGRYVCRDSNRERRWRAHAETPASPR